MPLLISSLCAWTAIVLMHILCAEYLRCDQNTIGLRFATLVLAVSAPLITAAARWKTRHIYPCGGGVKFADAPGVSLDYPMWGIPGTPRRERTHQTTNRIAKTLIIVLMVSSIVTIVRSHRATPHRTSANRIEKIVAVVMGTL